MHMKFVRARRFNLAVTLLLALAAPTLSLAQSLGAAPSWAQSMGPGTWAAISNNTIASVDPANVRHIGTDARATRRALGSAMAGDLRDDRKRD